MNVEQDKRYWLTDCFFLLVARAQCVDTHYTAKPQSENLFPNKLLLDAKLFDVADIQDQREKLSL